VSCARRTSQPASLCHDTELGEYLEQIGDALVGRQAFREGNLRCRLGSLMPLTLRLLMPLAGNLLLEGPAGDERLDVDILRLTDPMCTLKREWNLSASHHASAQRALEGAL
jgi:hypothetical protein